METVVLTSDFRVVIPQRICETLHLTPGDRFWVFNHGDRVELIRLRSMREMRGFLRGINTTIERDGDHP